MKSSSLKKRRNMHL